MRKKQTKTRQDQVATEEWSERYDNFLFRYALLRLREPLLAEEKTQETFLAALKARERFDGRASERTWLVGILKHKIIDYFREKKKNLSRLTVFQESSLDYVLAWKKQGQGSFSSWHLNPGEICEQKEFFRILNRCLAQMPQRLSKAFICREIYGLSTREISELMNVTVGNVYVMLHRARAKLKNYLVLYWVDDAMVNRREGNTKEESCIL